MDMLVMEKWELDRRIAKYRNMTERDLAKEMSKAAHDVASGLVNMAAIVVVADERGLDVESIVGIGMELDLLRWIGTRKLIPELASTHFGNPRLLRKAKDYSPEVQRRLAADEPLEVLEQGAGDEVNVRLVRPSLMDSKIQNQILGESGLRSRSEQERYILANRRAPTRRPEIYFEHKGGKVACVVIGDIRLTKRELQDLLKGFQ